MITHESGKHVMLNVISILTDFSRQ